MTEKLWEPRPEQVADSLMTAFQNRLDGRGPRAAGYAALHQWSIDEPSEFWRTLWEFADVRASTPPERIVEHYDQMPGARWFVGAKLNFAENLLRFRDARPALLFFDERGGERQLSYAELYAEVARAAAALRGLGLSPGDRVAAVLPNLPETVIAMLAVTSIGAVWSSCSPDFGTEAILDRFAQIEPRVLIGVDGYSYAGRSFDRRGALAEIRRGLPSLVETIVVRYADPTDSGADMSGCVAWADFLDRAGPSVDVLEFEQLPFDHPVYVLYSSGTTGPPKCIVHGAGGTLVQHLKELLLHTDLRREDRIFYFTTCGWMMWNWLVSALAVGASVVLYEGSPFHPSGYALFDMAERAGITIFGTSAKFLAAAESERLRPRERFELGGLRALLSTGSPLSPEGFRYVYENIGSDLRLSSISGGTDIVSCFLTGNPNLPVYAGELQCAGLGMAVACYSGDGRPLVGAKGELVCTRPFPSMPVGFLRDPDGSKYRSAYFERFPGVWHHGDFVELTERGTAIVYGRSDATLNPGGVRIGTAEIYRQVEDLPEVADSIVVGQELDGDVRVILFVQLAKGVALDADLCERIRQRIRSATSPRHVPTRIVAVDEVPYTRSGKKVELAVREVIHGREVMNRAALVNPGCLAQYPERLAAAEEEACSVR